MSEEAKQGGGMAAKVVRASAWSMGGYAASQAIRFGGNIVLTRLMFPDVFGLSSIVFTFIYGLQMFTDVGTGAAVVQSPRGDDPAFLDTAWTIQCIRGGFLFLAASAIALPVAWFYDQPLLAVLMPAAGVGSIFDGFASMSIHSAARHLRVRWTTFVEISTQVVNICTIMAVALALKRVLGPGDLRIAWAVIAGVVTGELTRLLVSHALVPGIRHRFRLDREATKVLYSFGRWVFVSTVLMFLATQSDRLTFAKLIPLQVLGVYNIAAALGAIPAQAVQRLSTSVLFPAYSRRQEGGEFRRVFWRARMPVLLASATLAAGLVAAGPHLIHILYDARYARAGVILRYVVGAAWFQMLEATNSAALLAAGQVRWMAAGNAAKLVGLVVLLPVGFRLGGLEGALVGLIAADAAKYATSSFAAARLGVSGIGIDLLFTGAVLVTGGIATAAGAAAAASSARPALVGFFVSGTCAAAFWAAAVGLWYRRRRRLQSGEVEAGAGGVA